MRGRKPVIREIEDHRKPIPRKTWKKGESEEKLKDVFRGASEFVERRKAWLRYLDSEFQKTKNPLCAWDARSLAREWGLPTPEWVESYLDRAGAKLLHAENKADVIPGALGFKGDTGGASQFRQYEIQRAKEFGIASMKQSISEGDRRNHAAVKAAEEIKNRFGISYRPSTLLKEFGKKPSHKSS
jgi:hypothetical protein